jgi:hypothetical protein
VRKPSNPQKSRAARHFVVAELNRRGVPRVVLPDGDRNIEIEAADPETGHSVGLRVKAKTVGEWQTSTELGAPRQENPDESQFWVLVDIGTDPATQPSYFVVPEWWIANYIHEEFQSHLESHGGERPRTPDSTHCAIKPRDVERWRSRWELLGLGIG